MRVCSEEGCEEKHNAKGLCNKHYYKNYRKTYANQEATNLLIQEKKLRNAAFVRELKAQPCVDCEQSYPYYVMQFDHVRGKKKFNLADYSTRSLAKILEESAKCDLLCSNCHAERTHQRRVIHRIT